MSSVFQRVREIVADLVGVHEATIEQSTTFEELAVDSLDMVELVIRIEDEFSDGGAREGASFEISDEQAKRIVSIGDVVDYLKAAGVEDGAVVAGPDA